MWLCFFMYSVRWVVLVWKCFSISGIGVFRVIRLVGCSRGCRLLVGLLCVIFISRFFMCRMFSIFLLLWLNYG